MKKQKLLKKIIGGSKNIRFTEMVNLVEGFGFYLEPTEITISSRGMIFLSL
jgi:hypothetical protein